MYQSPCLNPPVIVDCYVTRGPATNDVGRRVTSTSFTHSLNMLTDMTILRVDVVTSQLLCCFILCTFDTLSVHSIKGTPRLATVPQSFLLFLPLPVLLFKFTRIHPAAPLIYPSISYGHRCAYARGLLLAP